MGSCDMGMGMESFLLPACKQEAVLSKHFLWVASEGSEDPKSLIKCSDFFSPNKSYLLLYLCAFYTNSVFVLCILFFFLEAIYIVEIASPTQLVYALVSGMWELYKKSLLFLFFFFSSSKLTPALNSAESWVMVQVQSLTLILHFNFYRSLRIGQYF